MSKKNISKELSVSKSPSDEGAVIGNALPMTEGEITQRHCNTAFLT
ncbi:MAG: hypothetical protein IJH07_00435 [Ruminococcus sp.]|nr:hypothetical protein [Ruminococcus sp.]